MDIRVTNTGEQQTQIHTVFLYLFSIIEKSKKYNRYFMANRVFELERLKHFSHGKKTIVMY